MSYAYRVHGRTIDLTLDPSFVAVRFSDGQPTGARTRAARAWSGGDAGGGTDIPEEGLVIVPSKFLAPELEDGPEGERDAVLRDLRNQPDIVDLWPVFCVGRHRIIAANRLVIGLAHGSLATELCRRYHLEILETRDDRIVCDTPDRSDPFEMISVLDADSDVRFVEPDFITVTDPAGECPMPDGSSSLDVKQKPASQSNHPGSINDDEQGAEPWDSQRAAFAELADAIGASRKRLSDKGNDSPLMAVRITASPLAGGRQKTTNTTLARSINWARNSGADIITHGWVGGLPSNDIIEEFERARILGRNGLGCVMVIAPEDAGDPTEFPASLSNVLTVSAADWNDRAPMAKETAHRDDDQNGQISEPPATLSGACALILAANPELTEAQVRNLVLRSCDGIDEPRLRHSRPDRSGRRRLNVLGAVQCALAAAR